MAKQFRIQRTVAILPVTAAGFVTLDLPRGYDYESIYLRLTGQIQVTTAATSVRAEAPCQTIQRCEIIADGRNTLHSAPYWYSVLGHYDRDGRFSSAVRTPPSAASIATYNIEALGVIDLNTPDGERAKDSNFRTSGLQLFQLRLTFGNAIDNFVAGAGVAVFVGCTVEVTTSELVELPDASGAISTPVALKKVSFQEIPVPSTNANQEIRLPAGNMIKSVFVRTEGLTTAGEPTSAMINNMQVFSGVDVRANVRGNSLRAKNVQDFGYSPAGYYIVDLTRAGGSVQARLSELWDVTNQAEPKISMDVTGGTNCKVQAVITEYLAMQ